MKKILVSGLLLASITLISQNPVHFRMHSHNEIQDGQKGINYSTAATYTLIKTALTNIKDTITKYQAKWNLQAESNFIIGCLINDAAATSTVDLLQAFNSHSLIEVDPHTHMNLTFGPNYNPNNYADVAHLLDSCGLTPARTNVGGFLYRNTDWTYPTSEDWTTWKNGLKGNSYPSYTWTPTTLWGGGTPGHVADYNAFGVWRPAGTTTLTFGQNNTSNLINIGNGCPKWSIDDTTNVTALFSYVSAYINYCYSAPTATNTFYTASATMNLRGMLTTSATAIYAPMIDSVSKFIRKMNTLKQSGKIIWENLSETRAAWLTAHSNPADYFVVQCSTMPVGIDEKELNEKGFTAYPNPATNELMVYTINGAKEIKLFSLNGSLIFTQAVYGDETKINVSDLSPGLYILSCGNNFVRFVKE